MVQNKSHDSPDSAIFKKKNACALPSAAHLIKNFIRMAFLLLPLIVIPTFAAAQNTENLWDTLGPGDADQPWHLEADEMSYDDKADQYIAKGNVIIIKADSQLSADYVRFDRQTMRAYASGNVKVTVGNDILNGSSMDINLENQTGTIVDGYLFLRENNFHIKGKKIQKLAENTYAIENASVTTCDNDPPAWLISGKSLKVTIEGYGVIKHATMRTKNVPVFYTPYILFPAKRKRQSGPLLPQFGASERQGLFYIQPFFWAISESTDATFYAHYMSKRGIKPGLEFRYMLSEQSKGTLMFDYLYDRKVDDGTGDSSQKWGFGDDLVLRPNKDRYWFRNSHYQALPLGFFSKLNLDIVSDQDYLREFKYGYTGFFETEAYFNNIFNRVFDDYANPVRQNKLNFNRIWSSYSLNAEFLWFDNVINRRFDFTDTTLQKLPFISFDASKQRIFRSPFYFDLTSEYTYLYRQDGDKGHRIDIHPTFSIPYRFKNYFTFDPSIGLRETVWYVDPDEKMSGSTGGDNTFNRQLFDITIGLSSEISRDFKVNTSKIDRIKHEMLPKIVYNFIPDKDQSNLPEFDSIDRIQKQNLLTYSLTNLFVWRAPKTAKEGDDLNGLPNYDYWQFGRFELAQSYDINEAREDKPPGETRRPFSPISADLDVNLNRYLYLNADAEWDIYEDRLRSGNIGFRAADNRNDELSGEYRFTDNQTQSIFLNGRFKILDSLTAIGRYERNILDDVRINTTVGILYKSQCWSIGLNYIDEPDNRTFEFSINLFGLGEVGAQYGVD
jgi:LPS-assembly protein